MPFSERNRNRHIEDFANLAVFQLIQEYWLLVEDYIDDENVIYYFWVANNKKWIIEFLEKNGHNVSLRLLMFFSGLISYTLSTI